MEGTGKNGKDIGYGEAMGMVWDVLVTLLVSTLLFALGGRWMDARFGTRWIFTALGFILLALFGYAIIKKKGTSIAKRLDGTGDQKNGRTT